MQQPALAPAPHTQMSPQVSLSRRHSHPARTSRLPSLTHTPQEAASSAEQSGYPSITTAAASLAAVSASTYTPTTTAYANTYTYGHPPASRARIHSLAEQLLIDEIPALRAHLLPHTVDRNDAKSAPQNEMNIDPAISGVGTQQPQQHAAPPPPPPPPQVQQAGQSAHNTVPVPQVPQPPPQPQQPQSPGMVMMHGGGDGSASDEHADGSSGKGRGGKRELSTSKRAAQNRAAQVGSLLPSSASPPSYG